MARDAPALRVDGRRVDPQAFYAAACDPARSCVVEACAGSGKTWMLVSRMLRALLDGTPPHEILAITFTRAAAGEMRERLDEWLADFSTPRSTHDQRVRALVERGVDRGARGGARARARHAAGPRARSRAERSRSAPSTAGSRSCCGRRRSRCSTGSAFRPTPSSSRTGASTARPCTAPSTPRCCATRRCAPITPRPRRRAAGISCESWLDTVWDRRVEFELADEAGVLATSVERAEDVWPELAAYEHPAESIATAAWTDLLRGAARELASARGKLARDAAGELAAALFLAPRERFAAVWSTLFTVTDDKPRAFAKGLPLVEQVQDELRHLGDQVHQHESREEHLRMVRLGRALLAALADYKRAQGLADMADLERVALVLLRDGELSGWVQERLDARVAHLLIDEFQDTSPLQWHALHGWLSGYAGAGGGASGQRPPGVFIVGDPKQSIYRFRRAEPRVFEAAARFVREGLDGSVLACDHTRRNAPPVIEAINGVFAAAGELFPGFRRHTTEVGAVAASGVSTLPRIDRPPPPPSRRGDDAKPLVWRDSLTTPRLVVDEVLREREAEAVAEAVTAEIATGTRADEIYVLCRKRQSLRLVAHALERRHVGHSAVEDAMLAETPEAQDLIALLDVLVSTGHDLSLARALRSPLFGATDLDLLAIRAQAAEGASWWRALRELEAPSPAPRARAIAARALARARRRAAAARPARSHHRRGRRPRALRGRGAARAARVRARRDRRRARAIALSRRRPLRDALCIRARAQEAGREGGAAGARLDGAPAHRARREGTRGRHGFRDGHGAGAHQPADDDAARRMAGRGRAADAMRLRLQREPLPAFAARRARRGAAGARARGAERALRRDVARQAAPRLQRHRTLPGADRSDVVEPRRRGVPGRAAAASRAALRSAHRRRRSGGAARGHRHRDAAAVARALDRNRRPAHGGAGGERAHRPGGPPGARMDRRRRGNRSPRSR